MGCAPDQFVSMGSNGDPQGGGDGGINTCSSGGTPIDVTVLVRGGTGGQSVGGTDAQGSAGHKSSDSNTSGLGGATGVAGAASTAYHLPLKL
jgi:hypothetical protein